MSWGCGEEAFFLIDFASLSAAIGKHPSTQSILGQIIVLIYAHVFIFLVVLSVGFFFVLSTEIIILLGCMYFCL